MSRDVPSIEALIVALEALFRSGVDSDVHNEAVQDCIETIRDARWASA